MSEDSTSEQGSSAPGNLTVIRIPDDMVDAVVGFINELDSDETEVSGHMISGGALGVYGGGLMAHTKTRTDTGCVQTKTGVGVDFDCSDSDTVTN